MEETQEAKRGVDLIRSHALRIAGDAPAPPLLRSVRTGLARCITDADTGAACALTDDSSLGFILCHSERSEQSPKS
jgi:hypothetical protein